MKKRKKNNKKLKEEKNLRSTFSPKRLEFLQIPPDQLSRGERLRRERLLRGFSIETMARHLDVSPSYLGALERGSRPISQHILETFHERLNVSYDYLQDGSLITSATIHDFVRESHELDSRHNIRVLISVCSDEDADACYHLVRSYLSTRHQIVPNNGKDSDDPDKKKN